MADARAPYNFVPLNNKRPIQPYENIDALPRHDTLYCERKTGEIHVTLRAETPIFVSDGKKDNPNFFRGTDGIFRISGSSVRGLLRENAQILSNGVLVPNEDLSDYPLYFRDMASAKGSTGDKLKERYQSVLDIETKRDPITGKTYTVPKRVRSGYLCKKGEDYLIYPTTDPIRVSRDHPDVQQFGRNHARVEPVAYTTSGGSLTIVPRKKCASGMALGNLLYTGRPVGKQPNHLYLFSDAYDASAGFTVSEQDILAYQIDYESRKNSLKGALTTARKYGDKRTEKEYLRFWQLPEEGEYKPVFYAGLGGHVYFGMSRFIRVGYSHSVSEGLPAAHWECAETPLDFVHAVFGFAAAKEGDPSYRSRVSVSDFCVRGTPKPLPPVKAILGEPKPSWYAGYLEDGKTYEDDDFRLRGYKQYWLKDVQQTAVPNDKESVGTTLRPLDKGTEFRGVIRFHNLTEQELGLLLWSLRLDEGCFQTIGMGKPYGYGRVSVSIDELRELDAGTLYGADLGASPWCVSTDQVARYIDAYDACAAKAMNVKKPKNKPSIRSLSWVKDFFYLKSAIRKPEEVSYLALEEYKNLAKPLPKVETIREAAEKSTEPTSVPQSMDDWRAALKNKFGSVR